MVFGVALCVVMLSPQAWAVSSAGSTEGRRFERLPILSEAGASLLAARYLSRWTLASLGLHELQGPSQEPV